MRILVVPARGFRSMQIFFLRRLWTLEHSKQGGSWSGFNEGPGERSHTWQEQAPGPWQLHLSYHSHASWHQPLPPPLWAGLCVHCSQAAQS